MRRIIPGLLPGGVQEHGEVLLDGGNLQPTGTRARTEPVSALSGSVCHSVAHTAGISLCEFFETGEYDGAICMSIRHILVLFREGNMFTQAVAELICVYATPTGGVESAHGG